MASNLPDDYWVVAFDSMVGHGQCAVSAETARVIETALDQKEPASWITFRDIFGERARIRTSEITAVWESTAAGRTASRAAERARKAEEQAEKDWSVDGG